MGDLFKSNKKKLEAPTELTSPTQEQARSSLMDYASKTNPEMALQPYTGQLSASPQPYESSIADVMKSYINRQPSQLYTTAENQLQKTMSGGFDPATSDYYKAYRAEANRNLAESQTQARQAAQIGGMLRSTGRLNTENRLIGDNASNLNMIMAQLAQQERQNQLSAVPQALAYSQFSEQQPLSTLAAIMSAGGYQTGQQQSALDRAYTEWQRQASANQGGLDIFSIMANPSMYQYYQPAYQQSNSLSGLGMGLGGLAGALLAAPTGGLSIPMGAAIGAGLGGGVGGMINYN